MTCCLLLDFYSCSSLSFLGPDPLWQSLVQICVSNNMCSTTRCDEMPIKKLLPSAVLLARRDLLCRLRGRARFAAKRYLYRFLHVLKVSGCPCLYIRMRICSYGHFFFVLSFLSLSGASLLRPSELLLEGYHRVACLSTIERLSAISG